MSIAITGLVEGREAWPVVHGMSFSIAWRGKLPLCGPVGGGEMCCSESIFIVEILEELET